MNLYIKMAIGAAVGGVVGHFVASVAVAYMHMVEEAEGDVYRETEEFPQGDEADRANEESNQRPVEMSNHKVKVKTNRVNYGAMFDPTLKPDLEALVKKYRDGTPNEETEEVITTEANPEVEPKDLNIMIISMSEFANSALDYEQVTLNYYEDDVVTDQNDIPVPNVEELVGEDALVSFGTEPDPNVVYVRNHAKKAEYEIIRTETYYSPEAEEGRVRKSKEDGDEGEDS